MTGPRNPPIWEALAGIAVDVAAEALGLTRRGSTGYGPCPSCGAETRGRGDPRGPVGVSGDRRGWRCHACGVRGDVGALVAVVELGTAAPDAAGWARVRDRAEAVGLLEASTRPPGGRVAVGGRSGGAVVRPEGAGRVAAPTRARDDAPRLAPRGEVADVWQRAAPIRSGWWAKVRQLDTAPDCEGVRWLDRRGLGGDRADGVSLLDLARLIPVELGDRFTLPGWAGVGRMTWRDGWRLLLPTFDARGELAGLRARWIVDGDGPPIGGKEMGGRGLAHGGTVYADPVGRWLLARGPEARPGEVAVGEVSRWGCGRLAVGWRWSGRVVVAEGGADWLTAATAPTRARIGATTAAILGVWAGAWTAEIGRRLPPGCEVLIATDPDAGGAELAAKIRATLPPGVTEVVL
jgi:hypothetical protein